MHGHAYLDTDYISLFSDLSSIKSFTMKYKQVAVLTEIPNVTSPDCKLFIRFTNKKKSLQLPSNKEKISKIAILIVNIHM